MFVYVCGWVCGWMGVMPPPVPAVPTAIPRPPTPTITRTNTPKYHHHQTTGWRCPRPARWRSGSSCTSCGSASTTRNPTPKMWTPWRSRCVTCRFLNVCVCLDGWVGRTVVLTPSTHQPLNPTHTYTHPKTTTTTQNQQDRVRLAYRQSLAYFYRFPEIWHEFALYEAETDDAEAAAGQFVSLWGVWGLWV